MANKKTRKKRKVRNKKQRGGVLFRLTNANFEQYKPVTGGPMDCCPCVFRFLGLPDELTQRLSSIMPGGFSELAIEQFFSSHWPQYSFKFEAIPPDVNGVPQQLHTIPVPRQTEELHRLFSKIPPGYGVVGGYQRLDGSRHCVAFARSTHIDGAVPVLVDAQAIHHAQSWTDILNYIHQNQIIKMWILRSISKGRRRSSAAALIFGDRGQQHIFENPALSARAVSQSTIDTAIAANLERRAGSAPYLPATQSMLRAAAAHRARARSGITDIQDMHLAPRRAVVSRAMDRGETTATDLQRYEQLHHQVHPVAQVHSGEVDRASAHAAEGGRFYQPGEPTAHIVYKDLKSKPKSAAKKAPGSAAKKAPGSAAKKPKSAAKKASTAEQHKKKLDDARASAAQQVHSGLNVPPSAAAAAAPAAPLPKKKTSPSSPKSGTKGGRRHRGAALPTYAEMLRDNPWMLKPDMIKQTRKMYPEMFHSKARHQRMVYRKRTQTKKRKKPKKRKRTTRRRAARSRTAQRTQGRR